jgi:hypothetical protein
VCVCVRACRTFMLLPQVTLVCVCVRACAQNIYVVTTGGPGVCAEYLQPTVPCCHAAVGCHVQPLHFVMLAYTVEHRYPN